MIIFHVFLRIIALLKTPGPDPEGIVTGIIKAWTLERWVANQAWTLPRHLLFPRLAQKGVNGPG